MMPASAPPASITSACPRRTCSVASPIACAVGAADLLAIQVLGRIEVAHLARDRRLEAGRVKPRDPTDPAPPGADAFPRLLDRRAERGDHPDARDDDAPAPAVVHVLSLDIG